MRGAIQACQGVVVIDFGQGMAGSLPGMVLADNGAVVVKVEPPWGDWSRASAGFHMWNRGKAGVVLDLRDKVQRVTALELIDRADVVIESFRPGVAAKLGIHWPTVSARNPELVYCSITGFHAGSPHAAIAGYEAVVSARTGRMVGLDHLSGQIEDQDREWPIFTAAPVASFGASQLAVQGILAALLAREVTGRGDHLTTSLEQGILAFMMRQELAMGDDAAPSVPNTLNLGINLCFLTAKCKDGRYIQMCARQDKQFRIWLKALGFESKLEEDRYKGAPLHIATAADIDELELAIRGRMLEETSGHWMALFTHKYDVGADPFFTFEEFLSHPDMVQNDRLVTIDSFETGPCTQVGALALFSDTPSRIGAPAPSLGQDEPECVIPAVVSRREGSREPTKLTYPLEGVTVLEVAYFVAGPLGGALLAELGARVIKVEPLTGDPYRRSGLQATKFLHGKESIALDLKDVRGQKIMRELVRHSDVFVHSFRSGVPERLGIDYSSLTALNPRLVYVFAASYGSKGPQAQRTAYHSTPNALNGSGILQAGKGNPPTDDSYPDPGSALGVATAVLLGLQARLRTGKGQLIETTMLATSAYVMSPYLTRYAGMPPDAVPDKGQHGLHALYRLYQCREGWLFLGCLRQDEWLRLVEALGHRDWNEDPRFATHQARLDHDTELTELIADFLATDTSRGWERRLRGVDTPVTVVTDEEQSTWFEREHVLLPAHHPLFGDYWRPAAKVNFDGFASRLGPATGISEHARPILTELGYSDDDYRELVTAGVVGEYESRLLAH